MFQPMIVQELLETTRSYLTGRQDRRVDDFLRQIDGPMERRRLDPQVLPCLAHLETVMSHAGQEEQPLVRSLAAHARSLRWGQTYQAEDFGETFLENYGWIELFGTRGYFANERIAGGFLLLGPHIHYPDHHHVAEEIYVPLTGGAEWRAGDTGFRQRRAGEVIHHAPDMIHAMRTGDTPLLAFYLWRGGPLDQRSVIEGEKA